MALHYVHSFSSFSVDDQAKAQDFYANTLGLEVKDTGMGLQLKLADGGEVFIYGKPDHVPASFTVLNFVVEDIDTAVDELTASGVTLERYDFAHQDEKGIARGKAANMGPDITWFKDPAGNVLAVLQN